MDRFARIVLGFHGCEESFAADLLTRGEPAIAGWQPSSKPYDWLGHGIYFWEHSPERALRWAQLRRCTSPAVVGAIIQLGRCFDLTDVRYTEMLSAGYEDLKAEYEGVDLPLPTNRVGDDRKARFLDCAVLNRCLATMDPPFQTVRGAFWEGEPAYPGAMIRKESHVQVAVRDHRCILGVFRPRLQA